MIRTLLSRDFWIPWIGVIVVLLVWQFLSSTGVVNPRFLPGPVEVVEQTVTHGTFSELALNIGVSLARVLAGFLIGATIGVAVGITAGWYRGFGRFARGPIELLRPIPPLAWIPLAILWFGLGEGSKLFVISLGAFFPLVTNTYQGAISVDADLLRAARVTGLRGIRLLLRVGLPATLPDIATGVRVGWTLSFASVVAAELLAANVGLGAMLISARDAGEFGIVIAGVVLLAVLSWASLSLIQFLVFRRYLHWTSIE